MIKKTFTTLVAAIALTAAVSASSGPAQAGSLGRAIAFGALGFAAAAVTTAVVTHSRPAYADDCGYRDVPVYNDYGRRVGYHRVSAC